MNLTGDAPASQRSQGTCCGSDPKVGLSSWLDAGGVGIDTANDYNDQNVIGDILNPYIAKRGLKRSDFFITTKVPAGFGGAAACKAVRQWIAMISRCRRSLDAMCASQDPSVSLNTLKQNLQQLRTDYVDLVLLHKPCPTAEQNNALW